MTEQPSHRTARLPQVRPLEGVVSTTDAGGRQAVVSPADVVDVFVYVIVLNLAAEYFPLVITETFTLSLLTAVLLKVVLEVVVVAKNRVKSRLKAATTVGGKVLAGLMLWAVLVGSKFVVLELVALAFAGQVQLGGFFSVTALIVLLLLARAAVRWLLAAPGREAG